MGEEAVVGEAVGGNDDPTQRLLGKNERSCRGLRAQGLTKATGAYQGFLGLKKNWRIRLLFLFIRYFKVFLCFFSFCLFWCFRMFACWGIFLCAYVYCRKLIFRKISIA